MSEHSGQIMEFCLNCRFRDRLNSSTSEPGMGSRWLCLRFPPVFVQNIKDEDEDEEKLTCEYLENWRQPLVHEEDWCGEWAPRKLLGEKEKQSIIKIQESNMWDVERNILRDVERNILSERKICHERTAGLGSNRPQGYDNGAEHE
mgnify:CR=1 FL=1